MISRPTKARKETDRSTALIAVCLLALATSLGLTSCRSVSLLPPPGAVRSASPLQDGEPVDPLAIATAASRRAKAADGRAAVGAWLTCATLARSTMDTDDDARAQAAATLATRCSEGFLAQALADRSEWKEGVQTVAGTSLILELRDPSPNLGPMLRIVAANEVSMSMFRGTRHLKPGFGVPVALLSPRCSDAPACKLLPPSGVFRTATAWIEADPDHGPPRLVLAHPVRTGPLRVGLRSWDLAMDSSAFYAAGLQHSPIRRLALWGLFGGRELGRRAGVYLLEDYDPTKRPLVMVHGLGSSPLAWARMSNAIWADPELRARYQVWQLVYQTNDPILVARLRVQDQLDAAWQILDPEGDDPARQGIVLIGHSMGGVLSRLLLVDSGDALWNAAFNRSPSALAGDSVDLAALDRMFRFQAYSGVRRAVLVAAPHEGSPTADAFIGRFAQRLVGRRTPEIQALQRIARANTNAVPQELRAAYLKGSINSITTLRSSEPVMRVARSLQPSPGIPYHTIAGHLAGTAPPSDGVVPLQSALLAGSTSVLIVASGHNVHEHDEAILEVMRILHEDLRAPNRDTQPGRTSARGSDTAGMSFRPMRGWAGAWRSCIPSECAWRDAQHLVEGR